MPKVGNKTYPYTKVGKMAAKKAMIEEYTDASGEFGHQVHEQETPTADILPRLLLAKD